MLTRIAGVMAASCAGGCFRRRTGTQRSRACARSPDRRRAEAKSRLRRSSATSTTLVGFYTRQTLSPECRRWPTTASTPPPSGFEGELQRYSSQCGDCLQVKTDQFIQQPAPRIPEADDHHQCLRYPARHRSGKCRPHLCRQRPLRFAQQRSRRMRWARRPAPTTMPAAPPSAWNARGCSASIVFRRQSSFLPWPAKSRDCSAARTSPRCRRPSAGTLKAC